MINLQLIQRFENSHILKRLFSFFKVDKNKKLVAQKQSEKVIQMKPPYSKKYEFIRLVDKTESLFIVVANTRISQVDNFTNEIVRMQSKYSHSMEFPLGSQPIYMNRWPARLAIELSKEEFDELNKMYHDDKNKFIHYSA